jgi:Na+/glutamate symporter
MDAGHDYGIYGLLITALAGLIAQYLQARTQAQKLEQQRQWDIEDRQRLAAESKARVEIVQDKLHEAAIDLKANTALTATVAQKVDAVAQTVKGS